MTSTKDLNRSIRAVDAEFSAFASAVNALQSVDKLEPNRIMNELRLMTQVIRKISELSQTIAAYSISDEKILSAGRSMVNLSNQMVESLRTAADLGKRGSFATVQQMLQDGLVDWQATWQNGTKGIEDAVSIIEAKRLSQDAATNHRPDPWVEVGKTPLKEAERSPKNIRPFIPDSGAPRHIVLIGGPSWAISQPYHSLVVVAAIARQAGMNVKVYDFNVDFFNAVEDSDKVFWQDEHGPLWAGTELPARLWQKYESWLHGYLDQILEENPPSIFAFSVNFANRYISIMAAKYFKHHAPNIPILLGGIDCFPMEYNTRFLAPDKDWYCDIICQGEGEVSLKLFLEEFNSSGEWKTSLPGFAYYDEDKLVNTGDVILPTLQEEQPTPAFDLFDLSKYSANLHFPFFFTRGCVYKCHFCSERPNYKKFRCREPEEAFRELQSILPYARKYSQRVTLHFSDSNFNANPKRLVRFAELIIESGLDINWGGQAHIQKNLSFEVLSKLKKSGLVSIFWGVEHGSQHVIDLMNKKYDVNDARRIFEDCKKLGITSCLPFIIGYPGESPVDLVDMIQMIFTYQDRPFFKIMQPGVLVVRPNSPLYDNYESYGLANREYYEWCTADGSNTLPLRIARRFIVLQAHHNKELRLDALADTVEIPTINLNDPLISGDIFSILYEMSLRADDLHFLATSILDWSADSRGTNNVPSIEQNRQHYQVLWSHLDFNSDEGRKRIYRLILSALDHFKTRIWISDKSREEDLRLNPNFIHQNAAMSQGAALSAE